jgi:uncharacterized protein
MDRKGRHSFGVVLLVLLPVLIASWLVSRQLHQERLDDALFAAVRRDDAPEVRRLLAEGADANARQYPSAPQLSVWQYLLHSLRGRRASSEPYLTPLIAATAFRPTDERSIDAPPRLTASSDIITALLDRGASLKAPVTKDCHPLFQAVYVHDASTVQTLLEHGAGPDIRDARGRTPLMIASLSGDLSLVKQLIGGGADVNAPGNKDEDTALMMAVSLGNVPLVRVLLENGASVPIRDDWGSRGLNQQSSGKERKVILQLLQQASKAQSARAAR